MKIAVMQPYFMPYIGYFQLINTADIFVLADNMQYTRKGWFNRNNILANGSELQFTIPVKKAGQHLNVNQRHLANNSIKERNRILKQIKIYYAHAPYFKNIYPIIRSPFLIEKNNLFDFIYCSIEKLCSALDINTEIKLLSEIDINHSQNYQNRIIDTCLYLKGDMYLNPIGGQSLYQKEVFENYGIKLKFIRSKDINYKQFNHPFIPWLSIIDVLMFNNIETVKEYLNNFELV